MTLFGGDRSVAVRLALDPKGYLAGVAVARKATEDLARSAIAAGGKHRRSLDDIAGAATKAGFAIGGIAAVAVVSFAKFDQAMSRAQAGTQATGLQLEQLRQAAIVAGRDTKFSATEAADAITEMGKAGVSTQAILGGGLKGALALAAAGELQVKDAAEIAATALSQFGLQGKDLPHVADLLAAGAGKAQGSVEDLANALKYVGPVAHGMGISIEDTTGLLAEFASAGIVGEQAGTSLRGMLTSLTSPSKAAAAEMDRLGISLYDAQGQFLGTQNLIAQLSGALSGATAAQRDMSLGILFGNEQITAARVALAGGVDGFRKWRASVDDAGYASRQAGQLMNNLAGDVEQLRGSLETAFVQGGSGANDGLRSLVQGATTAVNAFSSLPAPVQQGTVVVAGLTAGTLLFAGATLKAITGIATMRRNLAELGITAERTRPALAAAASSMSVLAAFAFVEHENSFADKLDRELAALVKNGNADKARAKLEMLSRATGKSVDEIAQKYPAYQAALGAAAATTTAAAGRTSDLSEALVRNRQALALQADALDNARSKASDYSDAILGSRSAARDYQQALDDAQQSLKDNGRSLDINTDKGRANARALDAIAAAARAQAQGILDANGSDAQYRASLAKSRGELVKVAEQFFHNKQKAKDYVDQVLAIPATVTTKVELKGFGDAFDKISGLSALIASISGQVIATAKKAPRKADGGMVPLGLGGPRDDNVPAWLSSGEYVVRASSVAKYGSAFLDQVNAGRFADGGPVTSLYSLADVQDRYTASRPQPVTSTQVRSAIDAYKNATQGVDRAERALAEVRGRAHHTAAQVANAEDALDRARRRAITSRSAEQSVLARSAAGTGFSLAGYTAALASTVRQSETLGADLGIIAKRGGSGLQGVVAGLGTDGAQLAHALARANAKDFGSISGLLQRLQPDAFTAAAGGSGAGPLVQVGKVELLRGGPEEVAAELAYTMRSRGW